MASDDGELPSERTKAKLRSARDRLSQDLPLNEARKAEAAARLAAAVARKGIEVEAELHVRPVLTGKISARIGGDVSNTRIVILALSVMAVLATLIGGIYLLLNSSGTARLWR